MAKAGDLRSRVTDLVTCPICLELFDNPKSLQCLHTFCLKCIEGHCRDNEPGDELTCPICRRKFTIPENGVEELISNFFIADLVEARKTCSSVDCVVVVEAEPIQKEKHVGKCDKHADDDVKLYCFDCKKNLCVICFAEEHQQHKCKNVVTVAEEFAKQIDLNLQALQERVEKAHYERRRLDWQKHVFLASVKAAEKKIVDRGEELKQLIDKQVNERLQEVKSLNSEMCKKIDCCVEDIEMRLVAFETFSAYCSELMAKGKASDITRAASDLHIRATELQQTGATVTGFRAPFVMFEPQIIQKLLAGGQTVIGEIRVCDIDVNAYNNLNDCQLKIVLIGVGTATGASAIVHRFVTNEFTWRLRTTMGADYSHKTVEVGSASIKLMIADVERFGRPSDGNFRDISECLAMIRSAANPNVVNVLVGNKLDLDADRSTTFLEGKQFAEKNDLLFVETSAKTGENIDEAFLMCVMGILAKIATGTIDPADTRSGVSIVKRVTTTSTAAAMRHASKESCSCS